MKSSGRLAICITLLIAGCGGNPPKQPEGGARDREAAAFPSETASSEAAEGGALAAPPAAFLQCRSCHSVEAGQNGIGPSLYGVVGRRAGGLAGFDYTPALKGSGIVWDRSSLDRWLAAPMEMVQGTRMAVGVPDPRTRTEIIDYLATLK